MLIYILLLSVSVTIYLMEIFHVKKSSLFFCTLCMYLAFFFVSGIRFGIGADYFSYKEIFNETAYLDFSQVNTELFVYWIMRIINDLGMSFESFIVISSLIFVLFYFISLDDKKSNLACLCFLLVVFVPSFTLIAQYLSVSVLFLSAYFLRHRKVDYAYFFAIVSGLFHASAFLFLLVIFFSRMNLKWKWILFCLLPFSYLALFSDLASMILNSPLILSLQYGGYASTSFANESNLGSGFGIVLKVMPSIVIIITGIYYDKENINNRYLNFVIMLNFGFVMAVLLSINIFIFSRLVDLFRVGIVLGVYLLADFRLVKFKDINVLLLGVILMLILSYILMVNNAGVNIIGGLKVTPYSSIPIF